MNKLLSHGLRKVWIVHECLGIAHDAGHGCLEFMGNVLREFPSHSRLPQCLLAIDTPVHALRITMKQETQQHHHHHGEQQQMPVALICKRLDDMTVVVLKENEEGGIDHEDRHHAEEHLVPLGKTFHEKM